MRCPKCGYISFDRQKVCGKCSYDLTTLTEQLQGTASKAATPFFLGAVLGKQQPSESESAPALQEDEALDLDDLDAKAPPAAEDELDFAGASLDDDDLADQPLPSLGLEDIDVSDLVAPREEEEEALLAPIAAQEEEEETLGGIEFPGFDSDDTLNVAEKESPPDELEHEATEPHANAENEEIIDLSSLMNFEETPAGPKDSGADNDILDLSLEDNDNAPAEAANKPAPEK